jgi:hypothetical protein
LDAWETRTKEGKKRTKALLLYSILTRDEMSLEAHYVVPDVERSSDHNIVLNRKLWAIMMH